MKGHEESGGRSEESECCRPYVSLAGLRMRGWTGPLLHRLLGPPDRLSVDARTRAAPQIRLYRLERVEAAERSEEFRKGHAPQAPGPGHGPEQEPEP
ncbi:hypothetical protein QA802_11405 [Streptomyces sp. B21-105]|uniref:hypothetical protein n=1 Tax=Streptomyces sp. B21-105 TaxID=3039417 RepID=UPI002FEFB25A